LKKVDITRDLREEVEEEVAKEEAEAVVEAEEPMAENRENIEKKVKKVENLMNLKTEVIEEAAIEAEEEEAAEEEAEVEMSSNIDPRLQDKLKKEEKSSKVEKLAIKKYSITSHTEARDMDLKAMPDKNSIHMTVEMVLEEAEKAQERKVTVEATGAVKR
jgi:hypothetical protein